MQDLAQAPSLLTVILNWRTPEMTLRAAESALVAMQGITGAITIVDNASGDGSYEVISAAIEARGWQHGAVPVRVLQSGHNGGFGAGNNHGMIAGLPPGISTDGAPDYIYLLNSDAFPEPDAIRHLVNYLEQNQSIGFAGSHIYGEDGLPHRTAFRFPSALGEFEAHLRLGAVTRALSSHVVAMPLPETTQVVEWLAGASLMMRRKVLDQIGLFDESFFLYFEETDLCRRAALARWPSVYLPQSRVMHIGSVSTGMKTWQRIPGFWLESRAHYFRHNHGAFGLFAATLALALGGGLWRLRLLLQRKAPQDPPHFLRDLLAHHIKSRAKARDIAKLPQSWLGKENA